jgi:hypothetical protein
VLCSGNGLVTLGGPWINKAPVVEAVDNQASDITQHHVTGAAGEGRSPEPLVGFLRPLIACGRNLGVMHNRVDRVVFDQWAVEHDTGAERLNGFVARVGEGCRRLKADSGSPVAEREVRSMVEPQWGC